MEKCTEICADGAKAMMGENISFKSFVKAAGNNHMTFTHCMIPREALVRKIISTGIKRYASGCYQN